MECYCIGGPKDGEVIHIEHDSNCVYFPTSNFGAIRYKRHELVSPEKEYHVLIPNDWSLDKAMSHLLGSCNGETIDHNQ